MKATATRSRIVKKAGVALLVAGVLYAVSPRLFFLLLQLGGMAMMALSAIAMVVTFRKAKAMSPGSLVMSMGISVLVAGIIVGVSKAPPAIGLGALALVFGTMIGAGWALTTTVFAEAGKVRSRGSGWYLAVWVMTLMITQAIPMITGRTPAAASALLFMGTGLVLGNSSVMLVRWWLVRPQPANLR